MKNYEIPTEWQIDEDSIIIGKPRIGGTVVVAFPGELSIADSGLYHIPFKIIAIRDGVVYLKR